jgi:hypothetical protein
MISVIRGVTLNIQPAARRSAGGRKKVASDKEVLVDPNNLDKKLRISAGLEAK